MNTATLQRLHTTLNTVATPEPFLSPLHLSLSHTHGTLTPLPLFVACVVILPHSVIEKLSSKAGYKKILFRLLWVMVTEQFSASVQFYKRHVEEPAHSISAVLY